jgi:hypothetical protein
MRLRAPFAAALAVLAAAAPRLAHADAWSLAPGEYYSEIEAGRFVADTYYDAIGTRLTAASLTERRSLNTYNELGWKKGLSFVIGAPITSITDRAGTLDHTQTGLGDLLVGFRHPILKGSRALAAQLDWTAPLGYQTNAAPTLGDGLQSLTLSLSAGAGVTRMGFFDAGLGYRSRFKGKAWGQEDPSSPNYVALPYQNQVVWNVLAGAWVRNSLLVGAHLRGFATMQQGDAAADANVQRLGPELRYRVDDGLDVIAGSNHTASGRNIVHSDEYYVGVAYRKTKLNRLQGITGGTLRP